MEEFRRKVEREESQEDDEAEKEDEIASEGRITRTLSGGGQGHSD